MILITASALLIILASVVCLSASRSTAADGLVGKIIYADLPTDELLVSEQFGLIGRPDFILDHRGEYIPVERKSRSVSRAGPYEGEILQLAAYCLLVEGRFQVTVHRGQLQYLNGSIEVPFDNRLRTRLLRKLESVRRARTSTDIPRSHADPARCRNCGYRNQCGQALS